MGGNISITSSNVNILQDQSVLNQTIVSAAQQPSFAELLKLLEAVKAQLPNLPEEAQGKVQSAVAEAEHQVSKKEPDKAKALDSLKLAETILAQLPKTAAAAVTMGHLVGQATIYLVDILHKLCSIWQSTHMRYETVQGLSDEDFRRSTGVQRSTFDTMLKTVKEILRDFGRPPKLSRADQLLLTLMSWREYRTEFHIALAYGISESTVCRTIKKIENALIKSDHFHLPIRKCLQSGGMELEIIVVDATEQPVERQKKTAWAL